jgi:hypothetical protein
MSFFLTALSRELQKVDSSPQVMSYKHSMGTSACCTHAFYHHTDIFLQEAECLGWPIYVQPLNECLAEGWSLAAIHARLHNPVYHIESLGTIPNQGHNNFPPGTTPENHLPDFSIDKMHHQLVKFIVADDQVSVIHFLHALANSFSAGNKHNRMCGVSMPDTFFAEGSY